MYAFLFPETENESETNFNCNVKQEPVECKQQDDPPKCNVDSQEVASLHSDCDKPSHSTYVQSHPLQTEVEAIVVTPRKFQESADKTASVEQSSHRDCTAATSSKVTHCRDQDVSVTTAQCSIPKYVSTGHSHINKFSSTEQCSHREQCQSKDVNVKKNKTNGNKHDLPVYSLSSECGRIDRLESSIVPAPSISSESGVSVDCNEYNGRNPSVSTEVGVAGKKDIVNSSVSSESGLGMGDHNNVSNCAVMKNSDRLGIKPAIEKDEAESEVQVEQASSGMKQHETTHSPSTATNIVSPMAAQNPAVTVPSITQPHQTPQSADDNDITTLPFHPPPPPSRISSYSLAGVKDLEVFITDVLSPSLFWVHPESSDLEDLMDNLK